MWILVIIVVLAVLAQAFMRCARSRQLPDRPEHLVLF